MCPDTFPIGTSTPSVYVAPIGPTFWLSIGAMRGLLACHMSPFVSMDRHNLGPLGVALVGAMPCELGLPKATEFSNQFF